MKMLRDIVTAEMDALSVPDCDLRSVVLALAGMVDSPDRAGHLLAGEAGLNAIRPVIRELYELRSPLREQVSYERARRDAAAEGMALPLPKKSV